MDSSVLLRSMSDFCRTCMTSDANLTSLFAIVNISGKVTKKDSIASLLFESTSLQVEPSDGLPQKICQTCLKRLLSCHLFQITVHETQLKLQKIKETQRAETDNDDKVICIFNDELLKEFEVENLPTEEESLSSCENNEEINNTNPVNSDNNDPTGQPRPTYKCKTCSKICSNKSLLNRHLKIHGDFKKLQCHICLKRFTTLEGKERHLRVHTGEKPYNCKYCDRDFRQSSILNTHLKKIHHITPTKPTIEEREDSWKWSFLCTVCGHRYASSSGLTGHMRAKHPEEYERELVSNSKKIKTT
ncbi:zinc finger protein 879-like [Anthonomus grandis grandis]|uniref:zinc finger protein 879-like n=1 Tax=Anthonomus grandis grandis TaxID=2921223 RepID=UPI0021653B19|nr:zinc finger protein 879-like [Anthonomus grandis grandis]